MRVFGPFALLPTLAIAFVLCVGCNAPTTEVVEKDGETAAHDDHDHKDHDHAEHDHHHAETYAEAVAELETLRDTLRDSLKAGERDKGDVAVHEFGHVLDSLPKLAATAKLTVEQQADVKKDVEELFEHFEKIDEAFHGDKDQVVPYDEHAEKIDAAIERLHGQVAK
ncbi:MAG: hypothetical protein WD845_17245 [Pirellulales bacterium]